MHVNKNLFQWYEHSWASVEEKYRLSGISNGDLFPNILSVETSKIKVCCDVLNFSLCGSKSLLSFSCVSNFCSSCKAKSSLGIWLPLYNLTYTQSTSESYCLQIQMYWDLGFQVIKLRGHTESTISVRFNEAKCSTEQWEKDWPTFDLASGWKLPKRADLMHYLLQFPDISPTMKLVVSVGVFLGSA